MISWNKWLETSDFFFILEWLYCWQFTFKSTISALLMSASLQFYVFVLRVCLWMLPVKWFQILACIRCLIEASVIDTRPVQSRQPVRTSMLIWIYAGL